MATGPGGWTPARPGRRCGYDRFPEPDEPGEWDGVCTLTLAPGGAAVAWDDLPAVTADMISSGMADAAEEAWRDEREHRDEARADEARERAKEARHG